MAKAKDKKGITSASEVTELPEDTSPTMDRDSTPEPKKPYFQKHHEHKQDHISIECKVTVMDGKSSSRLVKIVAPEGCMPRSQVNNPELVFQALFGLLAEKFGANHIK